MSETPANGFNLFTEMAEKVSEVVKELSSQVEALTREIERLQDQLLDKELELGQAKEELRYWSNR